MNKYEQIEEIRKTRRMLGSMNVHAFAMIYGADYLKFDPSSAHKEMYQMIDGTFLKRGRRVVAAAPRGFGKTTTRLLPGSPASGIKINGYWPRSCSFFPSCFRS